jgi:hypothetical protein
MRRVWFDKELEDLRFLNTESGLLERRASTLSTEALVRLRAPRVFLYKRMKS